MKTFFRSVRTRSSWLVPTIIVCLVLTLFSFTTLPARAGVLEDKARKASADWKAAQAAVAAAKEKLAAAQKKLQNAMTAVAKSGGKATPEQDAALAGGRAEVAWAEAALREAEKQELAARVALEAAIADLPDGPLKDQLKRERNFPSLAAANGLYTIKFDTPSGQLQVSLPDDTRAGDTISGTVIVEPKGSTEEERNANRSVLNGFVIQIEGQKFPVNSGSIGPLVIRPPGTPSKGPGIPPALDSFFDVFYAVDLGTSPLGPVRIPLQPTHPSGAIITPDPKITPPTPPSGDIIISGGTFGSKPHDVDIVPDFNIPRLGQQGRPIVIPGPFDGDSSNTSVNWTGRSGSSAVEKPPGNVPRNLGLIAESPRKAVFQSPADIAGPMEVTVKEGERQTTGNYRNVGVNLSAPKTSLLKGESTELKVQVNGLEGLKEPVPLTLQCTGVITMTGGNYQPLTIQPSEISADGSYSTTRGITGVQAGGWGATATVVTGPFNVCLQDNSRPATVILWNTVSGDYSFRPPSPPPPSSGSTASPAGGAPTIGKGTMVMKGCILTLQHNAPDRRVFASLDTCTNAGNAEVENAASKVKFTITDRNTADNTCATSR